MVSEVIIVCEVSFFGVAKIFYCERKFTLCAKIYVVSEELINLVVNSD